MSGVDSWNVTLRTLEEGFFVGDAALGAERSAGVSWRVVEGLEAPVQFFRIRTDIDDYPELGGEAWLVSARDVAEEQLEHLGALLGRALPHVDFYFMVEQRAGFERVLGNARRAPVIAAAAAVVRYAAAWDETRPIVVSIGEQSFAASVGFEGKNYRVAVRRSAAPQQS